MKRIKSLLAFALLFSLFFITVPTRADEMVNDFVYTDLKGDKHRLSDHKGKWVLVNYWAEYCPPCLAEIPDINRFAQDNKKNFIALGVDAGGSSIDEIKAFKKKLDLQYPLISSQEEALLAFGIVEAIPTSYIISPKGELVDTVVGILTYIDLDALVNKKKK